MRARNGSVQLASWVVAAALLASPSRAGTKLDWVLDGCATQHFDTLVLSQGTIDCIGTTLATYTSTLSGSLTLDLDYMLGSDDSWLLIETDSNDELFSINTGSGSGWCSPPCPAHIVTHLQMGETVTISLGSYETWYAGGPTCTFVVSFEPDVGFTPGFGALDQRLISTAAGEHDDFFGTAVVFVGDVDGDGLADLAASGGGHVRWLSGATGATLFTADLTSGDAGSGSCLAAVGDVDGDGLQDVLVGGSTSYGATAGVYSSAGGQLLLVIPGLGPFSPFAQAVAAAGDNDADGVPDLLIGTFNQALAQVLSGADGALLLEVKGEQGDYTGHGVAPAGDFDGDGVPDIAVGSPQAFKGLTDKGVVRVRSGSNGTLLETLLGPSVVGALFGMVVAAAGDLDADGVPDLLASGLMEYSDYTGHVRAFSGATGALLFSLEGGPNDRLGESLSAAGDWDGDGHDDILAGAENDDNYVLLVSGATGTVLEKLVNEHPWLTFGVNTAFGKACAGSGDVDGDGRADFAVGAPIKSIFYGPNAIGKVRIYSGDSADWVPPSLTGAGTLLPSTPLTLSIADGDPFAPAFLVAGASALHVPFKGGLLMPKLDLLVPLVLDGSGKLDVQSTWPAGIPSGTPLWLQAWLPDDDGIAGYVASATLAIVPP